MKARPQLQYGVILFVAAALAASLIRPPFPHEQWLQHAPTAIGIAALALAAKRRCLSDVAMTCLAAMLLLHVVGARWIYSYVPYERWCDRFLGSGPAEWFGWTRNHYDRLVHFGFGALMMQPLAEVLSSWRQWRRGDAIFGALALVLAIGALYEVFEWLLAVVAAPDYADRYNGQQGDMWDPQKDMACALVGATFTAAVLASLPTFGSPTINSHEPSMNNYALSRRLVALMPFLLLVVGAIAAGGSFGPGPWYDQLKKPALTPPGWVFGAVWTPLYVMIALAGWRIALDAQRSPAMPLWCVQLALNVAWSWIFFGLHRPGAALVEIVVLWATIVATIGAAWRFGARGAAWLLVPYAAWVAFAALLNWQFWRLNG